MLNVALLLVKVADAMSLALSQNQKAEMQMLLIGQKRLPVLLEMATHFSKEKYNMGRSFACLKLPDLK